MVFLQSELETVTLFCGFMKSTLLCVSASLCFQRLEQLQNRRGSVVVKTDAGFTAGVNRVLLVAPNFWWRSKGRKEKSFHCWEEESGTFQIIIKHWPDAESCWEKAFTGTGASHLKCHQGHLERTQAKPMHSSAWPCSGAQLSVCFKRWLGDFNSQTYLGLRRER